MSCYSNLMCSYKVPVLLGFVIKGGVLTCPSVCLQGVFDHRMKTWQKWQDSQMLLQRKREAEAKLQFTNKPDKLQQAKDEIKEVRHRDGRMDVIQYHLYTVGVKTPVLYQLSC